MKPFCFVLMPFGQKTDPSGQVVDFDAVYDDFIRPAIERVRLEPIRADEELGGGIIHKPMYERLVLCEYAIADLTTANANVFYELGVRHAAKPWSTILLFAEGLRNLPFDVTGLRAMPYKIKKDGRPYNCKSSIRVLSSKLERAKKVQDEEIDSPVFQLLDGYPNNLDHERTEDFVKKVRCSEEWKEKLTEAKKRGVKALRKVEQALGDIKTVEASIVVNLFLAYRSTDKGYKEMIALVKKMSPPLQKTILVQEQLALALNREEYHEKAEQVLIKLLETRGSSSETYGLLGRIYKDLRKKALEENDDLTAASYLDKAIEFYLKGFEADWRDAYPGINALTLMGAKEPIDARRSDLLPVVEYAVERKIAVGKSDYWDHATRLELALLSNNEKKAKKALGDARTKRPDRMQCNTTLKTLKLLLEEAKKRSDESTLIEEMIKGLEETKQKLKKT